MIKKFILILAAVLSFSAPAFAKSGLNLFAYPREAPKNQIMRSDGKTFQLTDFPGQFVLAIFWSRHCAPCIRELDNLENFIKETKDNGITVLLISPHNEWTSASEQRRFLAKYKAPTIEFYTDEKGKLAEAFGIFASPHTVLIDTKGMEIGRIRGSVEWDDEDVIEYIYKLKAKHG